MSETSSADSLGRKVFFLHPAAYVQNQIISELAQEEFEVYIIKDEAKIRNGLINYPDSILIASIQEAMKENVWEGLIKNVIETPQTANVDIGIIASRTDEELKRKYMQQYKIRCGFTVIKSDLNEAIRQLVNLLNGVNAKGRRKYLRLAAEKDSNITVNLPLNGTYVNGVIKDISVMGFSCVFAEDFQLTPKKLLSDMQLRLQSTLVKAEGVVLGSRMDGSEKQYVVILTQRVDPSVKVKIRKFIQTSLQSRMDQVL